jgi:hypothetical protein
MVSSVAPIFSQRAIGALRTMRADAESFAGGVLARHGAGIFFVVGQERIVRRSGTMPASNRHTHFHSVQVPLHLSFRLEPQARERPDAAPFRPWIAAPHSHEQPAEKSSAHVRMLERIVARERRVHAITTIRDVTHAAMAANSPTASAKLAFPPPPARAVEMVTRRPAASASATAKPEPEPPFAPTPRAPAQVWAMPVPPQRTSAPATPIPLSPAELGRLTDQVVRAIDRRVVAARERQGRV